MKPPKSKTRKYWEVTNIKTYLVCNLPEFPVLQQPGSRDRPEFQLPVPGGVVLSTASMSFLSLTRKCFKLHLFGSNGTAVLCSKWETELVSQSTSRCRPTLKVLSPFVIFWCTKNLLAHIQLRARKRKKWFYTFSHHYNTGQLLCAYTHQKPFPFLPSQFHLNAAH